MSIVQRKIGHISVVKNQNVQSLVSNGLEKYSFEHVAFPEMNFDQIDTSVEFLSKKINMPLLISSMTGGVNDAYKINMALAELAHDFQLPICLGSLRILIEMPEVLKSFNVRNRAPNTLILANIGAVQLNYGFSEKECQKIIDLIDADALILHINPLQEVFQVGGNVDFSNLFKKIEKLCKVIERPIIVKEVGWGLSSKIVAKLKEIGVYAVDLACAGGTSWSEVESYLTDDVVLKNAAKNFSCWGLPLDKCLIEARANCPRYKIIASGGVKTGIDIAKCIALGANLCGIAYQLFSHLVSFDDEKNVVVSRENCENFLSQILLELKAAMFCSGAKNIKELSGVKIYKA